MDTKEIISQKDEHFEKAIGHFQEEAAKIRTGRANPSLVENLLVDYYGQKTPLKQMAAISIPEARQIMIQPWDRESLTQIEAAIRESDLGLNPNNDGLGIRLTLPQLNEDTRKDLVKVLNARAEESRIAVRGLREELWKEIQDLEKSGVIAEDDKFTAKELLQKKVDDCNQKIEDIRKKKEADILTV
jgi:ribosome recycling factor